MIGWQEWETEKEEEEEEGDDKDAGDVICVVHVHLFAHPLPKVPLGHTKEYNNKNR